ncbi:TonB-dependent receptor [Sphingomonas sp. H39-1-10]|uniref:TonB-dependent receptor n=1 Tax=Sphingomonas pollutisoli TaxID=3030829 RepID=UPI0023B918CA|nr:TonB-dependent receptor [Sphingomonas pollutisoli]MDF0487798.1 TonB-dependent receptor [Sphingomonas pollutisoli]
MIRKTFHAFASLSAIAAATAAAHAAPAAPAPAPETTPAQDADTGNDIIVTAQLAPQTAMTVPFALTAYKGEFLDELGITELDKLSRYVPGFVVQNQSPNNPGFVMRGITSDDGSSYVEPRVSVFQDGVSISKSRGSYVELFDLERIEIAKGPQSTLYGRGALIGAVNIVTAKADPAAPYGYFYGSYGNYAAYRLDATVNVPLTDTLAVRVAARSKKRNGYVENLLGGGESDNFNSNQGDAIRGSLHWAPGRLTVDLIGNYEQDSATGTSFKSIAFLPTNPTTGAILGDTGRNSGAALATPSGFEGGKPLGLERHVWSATGIANYDFDDHWSLNATGSYRRFAGEEVFDADGISLPLLTAAEDARGNQTMATLRLAYKGDTLDAFVGGTYFHEDGSQRAPAQFDERAVLARLADASTPGVLAGGGLIPGRAANAPAPIAIIDSAAFAANILQRGFGLPAPVAAGIANNLQTAHLETNTNTARTNSIDVFGDVTLHVTDKLDLGGGIRYSHDDKRTGISVALNNRSILGGVIAAQSLQAAAQATAAAGGNPTPQLLALNALLTGLATPGAANAPVSAAFPLFGLGAQPTAGNGSRVTQGSKDDGLTWRATARYAATHDLNLYATYARGRRPEVLSVSAPSTPYGAPNFRLLPAETVDSFEVGAKSALLGRTLFADGSVFYYKYNNFQTTEQVGTQFITTNAGKAESYGFEGQIRYVPVKALTLFGTYSYSHGRFKEGARKGNRFRLSPDNALSAGFIAKLPAGPVTVDFTPSVTYQSSIFFDDDNDKPALQARNLIPDLIQDEYQKGYALVDARLGIEPKGGVWRLEAFVTNLFDKKYIKDAGNTGDSLGLPTFIGGEPRFYGLAISFKTDRR